MAKYFCIVFYLCSIFTVFSQTSPELHDILGAPYCGELCASEDGQKIAWVVNEAGIRSLFTAEAPLYTPELRYRAMYDDGQVIGNLDFDHQCKFLYFVKGSAPNRDGEIANPSSEVVYPGRFLFRVDLSNNLTDTVGPYSSYTISPDDRYLLLNTGNKVLKYDLETKHQAPVIEMRGAVENISFHPDGQSIIFTSNRTSHNFIGYFKFGTNRIEWIGPSLYRDQSPVWSLDGNQVAFIRIPGQRKGELADITGGTPFSLMVYSFVSKELTELWSSPSDDGGFAQYYHDKPLRWATGEDLLFYSEHEGFMKIYRLNVASREVESLLSGECEIEHSHLTPDGSELIFSSNCGDIDRRHLYGFDLVSGRVFNITGGQDIETDPVFLGPGVYAYRKSGYNFPPSIVLNDRGKEKMIFPVAKQINFPMKEMVDPQQVVFEAADGSRIHGQLFVKGTSSGKPGILYMHGGPIRQMLSGYHYSEYYAHAYALNQYLANLGYVVLSVNYRAGIGYGKVFRRAAKQGPRGVSEYQDIVAAARYLQNLSYIDPQRIGLWGGSYGGFLTAQGLARNSDIFKAGVDFHGVHDWSWRATDFSKGGFWGITEELMELAYQSSPVAQIKDWKSPVLLIHGDDDRNVMFGQSIDLAERLREQGVHYEVLVLPDEVHGFYRYNSWLTSFQTTVDFFDRFLR